MDATVPFDEQHPGACVGFKRTELGKIERIPNLTRHWPIAGHCSPLYAFKFGMSNGKVGISEVILTDEVHLQDAKHRAISQQEDNALLAAKLTKPVYELEVQA